MLFHVVLLLYFYKRDGLPREIRLHPQETGNIELSPQLSLVISLHSIRMWVIRSTPSVDKVEYIGLVPKHSHAHLMVFFKNIFY